VKTALLFMLLGLSVVISANSGWTAETVDACSCGPSCEQVVHEADLIVEGRITDWERTDDYPSPSTYVAITLHMEVVRVFRGSVPPGFTLVDQASLYSPRSDGTDIRWEGSGGGCGSFDEEPHGLWVIAALYRDELGNYRMGRPSTVFLGKEAAGGQYDFIVANLIANVGPPVTGSGLQATADGFNDMQSAGIVFLCVGSVLGLASRRITVRWRR
jgi:hypothetical protein